EQSLLAVLVDPPGQEGEPPGDRQQHDGDGDGHLAWTEHRHFVSDHNRFAAVVAASEPKPPARLPVPSRTVAQQWLDQQQQRTWRAWLTVSELVPRVLDAQLQRGAGLTHAAYVALAMLSEPPNRSR